jgi:predicted nuclease with TOPRIM domain
MAYVRKSYEERKKIIEDKINYNNTQIKRLKEEEVVIQEKLKKYEEQNKEHQVKLAELKPTVTTLSEKALLKDLAEAIKENDMSLEDALQFFKSTKKTSAGA